MSTLPLIDIGVNLTHASFRSDLDAVLGRAADAGVHTLIVTGTSERASREAIALCQRHPHLYATCGVHPHGASAFGRDTAAVLRGLLARPQVVAVGECGLDFNRDFSPRPAQEAAFAAQLDLAVETGRPLFLHERDAHLRFLEVLRGNGVHLPPAVVHCFTGSWDEARAYLDLGLYLGITGWICDERRGFHLRDVVRRLPLDRLMLETDAPFLTPRSLRGAPRRNEPGFLPHVLTAVAHAKGLSPAEVAAATTATAQAFFRITG